MASLRRVLRTLQKGIDEANVKKLNELQIVDDESDLPELTNGEHQLEDNVAYQFQNEVQSDAPLRLGDSSPILGTHRERDWFIYNGGGDAILGSDKDVLLKDIGLNAPGGTLFDVDGGSETEFYADTVYFADDQQQGNISDLGTVEGFRAPSLVNPGIRDFDAGLTFTGTTDIVTINEAKIRDITAGGVTAIDFDANFECETVEIAGGAVRDVQSDTEVVNVDASATINRIFLYSIVNHDDTVTQSNILNGQVGVEEIGTRVSNSFPLADSAVVGELSLDSSTAINTSGAGQDTFTVIDDGATTLGGDAERVSQQSDGVLQYDGKKDTKLIITANLTVITGGDTVEAVVSVNDTIQPTSAQRTQGAAGVPIPLSLTAIETLETDDTVEVQIKNVDAASDITAVSYNLNFK